MSDNPENREDLQEMGIFDHLEDLRWCLVRSSVVIALLFPLGVIFADDIVDYTVSLSNVPSFITTGPAEIFMQKFRIGFMVALYVSLPYVMRQIWAFISPGLYEKERNMGRYATVASYALFLAGSLFGLLVIVPICLNFFSSLETQHVQYTPRLTEMISFILRIAAATGLASQLPVVVVILFALGLVSIETLSRVRPWVIVGVFVAAAVLTPPDVTSQLMLGLPTCLIYEMSIIVCRILNIGKEAENSASSKFIKAAAFTMLFAIVFGGAFGIWYTWNWYKTQDVASLVADKEDLDEFRAIFEKEDGPAILAKALAEKRDHKEQHSSYSILLENWNSERLLDEHRQAMLQFAFNAELELIRDENSLHDINFKVTRQRNIPADLNFYWQLEIDDRSYLWPDDDNNLRYSYAADKAPENFRRDKVLANLPAAAAALKKTGNHRLQLILKVVSATTPDGSPAPWADLVHSAALEHSSGSTKK
jgi:sec-independent protein translocase protein TatC